MKKRKGAESGTDRKAKRVDVPAAAAPPEEPACSTYESDGRVAKQPRVIVVLERACLETGKVGSEHVLLNSDDHGNFLRKHQRDPAAFRPDILHQSMLMLLDSPLNKAGLLKLFVRTEKGVLIEVPSGRPGRPALSPRAHAPLRARHLQVSPQIRIPRTFRRFCGLMTQLLFKLSIRASNGPHKLLKVVKNPVTDHLPPNCRLVSLSYGGRLVSLPQYVPALPQDVPIVFVAGAMAHGSVSPEYPVDETISISEYPLSAAAALARLCTAFENHIGIL